MKINSIHVYSSNVVYAGSWSDNISALHVYYVIRLDMSEQLNSQTGKNENCQAAAYHNLWST